MRILSITLGFLLSSGLLLSNVEAGVTSRSMQAILKSSQKRMTPLISELDIAGAARKSRELGTAGKGNDVNIVFLRPTSQLAGENLYFRAALSEDLVNSSGRFTLTMDIRGVDHITKNRIKRSVQDLDWEISGHFSSARIKKYKEETDSLLLQVDLGTSGQISYENLRGIKKIVDSSLRFALENGKSTSLRPFLTREATKSASNGSR